MFLPGLHRDLVALVPCPQPRSLQRSHRGHTQQSQWSWLPVIPPRTPSPSSGPSSSSIQTTGLISAASSLCLYRRWECFSLVHLHTKPFGAGVQGVESPSWMGPWRDGGWRDGGWKIKDGGMGDGGGRWRVQMEDGGVAGPFSDGHPLPDLFAPKERKQPPRRFLLTAESQNPL